MNPRLRLEAIKGVGPKTALQFAAAGIETVEDLVLFLPRKYEDYSQVVAIRDIRPGKQTIRARCEKIETKRVRRGLQITTAVLTDGSGKLQAVWFNQPYRAGQLGGDEEFYFSGEFEFSFNRYQLTNPSTEQVSATPVSTDRIVPVYRAIKGLKSQVVRKVLIELKPYITMLDETLPQDIVANEKLLSYADALLALHFPKVARDVERGQERIAYEELFSLLLAAQLNKRENASLIGWTIHFDKDAVRKFVAQLPFQFPGVLCIH